MRKVVWVTLAAAGVALILWWILRGSAEGNATVERGIEAGRPVATQSAIAPPASGRTVTVASASRVTEDDEPEAEEAEKKSSEELREEAEEARVEAFDALTDAWMEPKNVTVEDVSKFVRAFKDIPKDRQDECVHRALNLIPDENVLLLAGLLTDKSIDRELVETVFNDILNRDEDVKKPLLELVYKDKTHPCWADVAWIFDVTGEGGSQRSSK